MISEVKRQIENVLQTAIQTAIGRGELSLNAVPDIPFSPTRTAEHGDIASPIALSLAKAAKMPPRKIAEVIVKHIHLEQNPVIRQIDIAGPGFINLFLSNLWLYDVLRKIHAEAAVFGKSSHGNGARIQVEFVSANPTGPLNIVSGRAAAVGDAIVNLLNAVGYDAIREYYVNDAGGQVERLGESIDVRYRQLLGEADLEIPDGGYHGEYLIALAQSVIDAEGDGYLKRSHVERIATFRDLGIQRLLAEQKATLEQFGVYFDVWTSEKAIRDSGKPHEIIKRFRERNYLYEADGATWFRMTHFGDDKDCVVIRSDGEYTYFVPDAAYHANKFERGFDKAIDLLGPDHQGHVEHLKNFVKALGFADDWLEIMIIQQVNLIDQDGNRIDMSKRRGQFYTLDTLLDELAQTVDEEETAKEAKRFAVDVARYFFLTRSNSSHLDFDLKLAITRANENPVFYVQYAHARACSIFREMRERGLTQVPLDKVSLTLLCEPEPLQVIRKLAEFPEVILGSAESREAHRVTHYLHELASLFHTFYNQYRVLNATQPAVTQARLVLVDCVRTVLKDGLMLLGVSAPEAM